MASAQDLNTADTCEYARRRVLPRCALIRIVCFAVDQPTRACVFPAFLHSTRLAIIDCLRYTDVVCICNTDSDLHHCARNRLYCGRRRGTSPRLPAKEDKSQHGRLHILLIDLFLHGRAIGSYSLESLSCSRTGSARSTTRDRTEFPQSESPPVRLKLEQPFHRRTRPRALGRHLIVYSRVRMTDNINTDIDSEPGPCSKQVEPLPHSFLGWIPHIIRTPARTILHKNGLDAYIFVRFLFLMLEIFFPL